MQINKIIIFIILIFISSFATAKNSFVFYDPVIVELEGFIKILTFPGPPNYQSIKNGDTSETGAYLVLKHPIDVISKTKNTSNNDPEKNIKIIQLVINNENDWKAINDGIPIKITGTLFHAITGHHHARILIFVKKFQILSEKKFITNKLPITKEDRQYIKNQNLLTSHVEF